MIRSPLVSFNSRLESAVSTLLSDLSERGLLDETLVLCLGEFGRSPRVNHKAGRDHWPQVANALVAGAGIPGGTVVGASDREGAYPAHTPITPAEARLATEIARGLSVNEYCAQHGISANTARTHLRRALSKTDTHRQAQLVSLVDRLSAMRPVRSTS